MGSGLVIDIGEQVKTRIDTWLREDQQTNAASVDETRHPSFPNALPQNESRSLIAGTGMSKNAAWALFLPSPAQNPTFLKQLKVYYKKAV